MDPCGKAGADRGRLFCRPSKGDRPCRCKLAPQVQSRTGIAPATVIARANQRKITSGDGAIGARSLGGYGPGLSFRDHGVTSTIMVYKTAGVNIVQ